VDVSATPIDLPRATGLPSLRILPTPGRLSITPASLLCLETIDRSSDLLAGRGIDWGSGSGILAVALATLPGVDLVVGFELEERDIATARTNAELNGVADRTIFIRANLFDPLSVEHAGTLDELHGTADFLVANPPASIGDDGLGWRRAVLVEGARLLRPGATVLLQISRQYGTSRIERLTGPHYRYEGLLGSTGWVPFDLERDDLLLALRDYADEEKRTGEAYPFLAGDRDDEIDARTALAEWGDARVSPRSQWQVHHFTRG
jgi:hypothetical protein